MRRRQLVPVWLCLALSVAACEAAAPPSAAPAGAPTAGPRPAGTSAAVSTHAVQLKLEYHFEPRDGSGLAREHDNVGSPCGTTRLTLPTDTLAFLQPDSRVVLDGQAGTTVARTRLDFGLASKIDSRSDGTSYTCTWATSFADVPDSPVYSVLIDQQVVGTFTLDELQEGQYAHTLVLQPAAGRVA